MTSKWSKVRRVCFVESGFSTAHIHCPRKLLKRGYYHDSSFTCFKVNLSYHSDVIVELSVPFFLWMMISSCLCVFLDNSASFEPRHEKTCYESLRLIIALVVRCLDSIVSVLAKSKISRLWLVSVADQAGLNLNWSQTSESGFLVTWLTYKDSSRPFPLYFDTKLSIIMSLPHLFSV